jgi:hypothetical protein
MAQSRPKVIIRTVAGNNSIPAAVREKVMELTRATKVEFLSIRDEKKHDIHFKRRIEALDKGAELLLNSLGIEEKARTSIVKSLQELQGASLSTLKSLDKKNESSIKSFQNVLIDHTESLRKILRDKAFIPQTEINHFLGKAEEYANMAEGRLPLCTVTPTSDGREWIVQLEIPQDPLSEEKKQEFLNIVRHERGDREAKHVKIPEWFNIMPQIEKDLFLKTFKDAEKINDITAKASTISSKLRTIPGVANFSRHIFMIMDKSGNVSTQDQRLRSSMVASRDLPKDKTQLREEFTRHNIEQIIDTMIEEQISKQIQILGKDYNPEKPVVIPVLMQTLITPFKEPDSSLFRDKEAVIKRLRKKYEDESNEKKGIKYKLEFISTNHPLNPGRFIKPTSATGYLAADQKNPNDVDVYIIADKNTDEITALTDIAMDLATKRPELLIAQKAGIAATALKEALKWTRWNNERELYISALEQITTSLVGGIAYGSCVSGKDRKGIETMYTDAMRLYLDRYGKIPPISNTNIEDRKNFIDIFTEIYVTRHQHENAGQNAPGADGIKTPHLYLPYDMLAAIAKKMDPTINSARAALKGVVKTCKECDRLASNNEVEKIKSKNKASLFKKIGKALGSVSHIFTKLKITSFSQNAISVDKKQDSSLSSEESKLIDRIYQDILRQEAGIPTPTGIKEMIKLYKEREKEGKKPTLAEFGKICQDRFVTNPKTRTAEIKGIYETIVRLAAPISLDKKQRIFDEFKNDYDKSKKLENQARMARPLDGPRM